MRLFLYGLLAPTIATIIILVPATGQASSGPSKDNKTYDDKLYNLIKAHDCTRCWDTTFERLPNGQCKGSVEEPFDYLPNLPTLDGIYCFNNGTGICKAFAGRFEFYFNSWTKEILGSAPASRYVDQYGYHARVPASYTTTGEILYVDRSINWAKYFTAQQKKPIYNLLNSESFNWCSYASSNNWPYKSAILDHDKISKIYFHNRQACIYKENEPAGKTHNFFNNRFVGDSRLRIDLDYNPTVFAMEDNLAGEVRMVKHFRQHWYEIGWRLVPGEDRTRGVSYKVVKFDESEKTPCIINATSPRLLSAQSYAKFTRKCISDFYTVRESNGYNNRLVHKGCGLDRNEVADFVDANSSYSKMVEVATHQIPFYPNEIQPLFGVNIDVTSWVRFARDGYAFSAATLRNLTPLGEKKIKFEMYMLYSDYGRYDSMRPKEAGLNFPVPMFTKFETTINDGTFDRTQDSVLNNSASIKNNLNYVDDIAWLPNCQTILVVFGPLYTEFKLSEFNLETKTYLRPISDLGLNELTSAFFARDDKIYFYHRVNYVAEHVYKCGGVRQRRDTAGQVTNEVSLVTASRVGQYRPRYGKSMFGFMRTNEGDIPDFEYSEEKFFQLVEVFKRETGKIGPVEAPEASQFPWSPNDFEPKVASGPLPASIWALIGLGILGLLIMFILGFITVRRIVRRRRLARTIRSEMSGRSNLGSRVTNRSALSGASGRRATHERSTSLSKRTRRSAALATSAASGTASSAASRQPSSGQRSRRPSHASSHASTTTRRPSATQRSSNLSQRQQQASKK